MNLSKRAGWRPGRFVCAVVTAIVAGIGLVAVDTGAASARDWGANPPSALCPGDTYTFTAQFESATPATVNLFGTLTPATAIQALWPGSPARGNYPLPVASST